MISAGRVRPFPAGRDIALVSATPENMDINEAKAQLVRRAIRLEIGGFRPPENADASWLGQVNLAAPGEEWPRTGREPMDALCQINIDEMPFRPPGLEDIGFISVFIGPATFLLMRPMVLIGACAPTRAASRLYRLRRLTLAVKSKLFH